jgi:acetyltransferase
LARQLIKRTKVFKLLEGYRGMKGVDIDAIQFMLYKFAYLVMDFPEINEIEMNPLVVDEHGAVVLDARVTLDQKVISKPIKPYSHLSISPYPKEYVREFRMKNGKNALFRPIKPEDEPLEAEMLANTSNQSQYFRFFGPMPKVTHEMLIRYTQIDYDREIAIMAEVEEEGEPKMAAVVRLVLDTMENKAEYAILVADPWQNQGLGSAMTDYILEIALRRGIDKIYANVLNMNEYMIGLFKKKDFAFQKVDLESSYVEKKLAQAPATPV